MMKHILFITGSMGRGGAERVISLLGNHYINKNYNVSILMLLHSEKSGYQLDPRIQIIDISNDKVSALRDIPRLIVAERKVIKSINPDVIVCFMAQNILITGLAAWGLRKKIIVSERIDPAAVKRNWLYRKLLNQIYSKCKKTILQTKRAWDYFPQSVRNNSIVIPNPVSTTCIAGDAPSNRIVTAGRLTKQKNHELLIKAFKNVSETHPDFVLDIYGDGPEKDRLQKLINELNLSSRVSLKGSSNKLHQEISDAYMFVLSSDFEGLSNALIEALMMGLPTISTNCSGSDEIILDGKNGLLVPVGNLEVMTEKIELLIADSDLCHKLRNSARQSVMFCSFENVINEWEKVIEGADKQ